MDFLNLLQNYPVLWQYRKEEVEAYDLAMTEITEKINKNWNLKIEEKAIRRSLRRIKGWYHRIIKVNGQQIPNSINIKTKYNVYFDKCAEFLPKIPTKKARPLAVPCSLCKSSFVDEIHLQVHKFQRHKVGELPYKCSYCDWRFENPQRVRKHEIGHTKIKSFFCNDCGKGFYHENMLEAHMVVHSAHVCEICGKHFADVISYRSHRMLHEKPKHKCRICSKAFHKPSWLRQHMKNHGDIREFICELCGKSYKRNNGLKVHMVTAHSGIKAFLCNICNNRFSTSDNLNSHRKNRHLALEGTNEYLERKPYMRPTKYNFIIDPRTQRKRLVCDTCGKSYGGYNGLRKHRLSVHGNAAKKLQVYKYKQPFCSQDEDSIIEEFEELNEYEIIEEIEVSEEESEEFQIVQPLPKDRIEQVEQSYTNVNKEIVTFKPEDEATMNEFIVEGEENRETLEADLLNFFYNAT